MIYLCSQPLCTQTRSTQPELLSVATGTDGEEKSCLLAPVRQVTVFTERQLRQGRTGSTELDAATKPTSREAKTRHQNDATNDGDGLRGDGLPFGACERQMRAGVSAMRGAVTGAGGRREAVTGTP